MFKFFAGLAIGVVGGAAFGSVVTIRVASQNPHIKRAIGQAVAVAAVNYFYGPEDERIRARPPQTPFTRYA